MINNILKVFPFYLCCHFLFGQSDTSWVLTNYNSDNYPHIYFNMVNRDSLYNINSVAITENEIPNNNYLNVHNYGNNSRQHAISFILVVNNIYGEMTGLLNAFNESLKRTLIVDLLDSQIFFGLGGVEYYQNDKFNVLNDGLISYNNYEALIDIVVDGATENWGGGNINQAGLIGVSKAITNINHINGSTKVVLLFGKKNAALTVSINSILNTLKINNTTVYCITGDPENSHYKDIADATGGMVYDIDSTGNYDHYLSTIANDIIQSYRIAYESNNNNNFDSLNVEVSIIDTNLSFSYFPNPYHPMRDSLTLSYHDTIYNSGALNIGVEFEENIPDSGFIYYRNSGTDEYTKEPLNENFTNSILAQPTGLDYFFKFIAPYSTFSLPSGGARPNERPFHIQASTPFFEIEHEPVLYFHDESQFVINITGAVSLFPDSIHLFYRLNRDIIYDVINQTDLSFSYQLTETLLPEITVVDTLEYFLVAYNGTANYMHGSFDWPHKVFYNAYPSIIHNLSPINQPDSVNICADIYDNTNDIDSVEFYYKLNYESDFSVIKEKLDVITNYTLCHTFVDTFIITHNLDTLQYYFRAVDDYGLVSTTDIYGIEIFINEPPVVTVDSLGTIIDWVPVDIWSTAFDTTHYVNEAIFHHRLLGDDGELYTEQLISLSTVDTTLEFMVDTTYLRNLDTLEYFVEGIDDVGLSGYSDTIKVEIFINDPPIITVIPDSIVLVDNPIPIRISAYDTLQYVSDVLFHYKKPYDSDYQTKLYVNTINTTNFDVIDSMTNTYNHNDSIYYYIELKDNYGSTTNFGNLDNPETIRISDYLCDFDYDHDVDFADYTLFLSYWNAISDSNAGDIADTLNSSILQPWAVLSNPHGKDGIIDPDDGFVFAVMYNWFNYPEYFNWSEKIQFSGFELIYPDSVNTDESFNIEVICGGVTGLIGINWKVTFLGENNRLLCKEKLVVPSFDQYTNMVMNFDQATESSVELGRVMLGHDVNIDTSSIRLTMSVKDTGRHLFDINQLTYYTKHGKYTGVDLLGKHAIQVIRPFPEEFTIYSVYPNPFNPVINISYSVPKDSHVYAAIYNLLGQRVDTILDDDIPAGENTVRWNGNRSASGIYFIQFINGDNTINKKIILLK